MKEIYFESEEYDALAAASINITLCKKEPELYTSKWWDYRLLHPTQATYLFADAYLEASRKYAQRNIDLEYGKVFKPYPGKDLFAKPQLVYTEKTKKVKQTKGKDTYTPAPSKQTIAGIWKARQMADKLGIPYRFYCDSAIAYTEKGLWHRLPSPSHLYATKVSAAQEWREESMVDFIIRRWREYCSSTVVYSTQDYFKASNNENGYDQIRHRADIMNQIKKRPAPELGLSQALCFDAVLIREECIRFFGEYKVEKAERLASS